MQVSKLYLRKIKANFAKIIFNLCFINFDYFLMNFLFVSVIRNNSMFIWLTSKLVQQKSTLKLRKSTASFGILVVFACFSFYFSQFDSTCSPRSVSIVVINHLEIKWFCFKPSYSWKTRALYDTHKLLVSVNLLSAICYMHIL